jgi:large subunit ribosomal protein L24
MKIRKGDKVRIIAGNDRGKTGTVLGVIPSCGKIIVEGTHVQKKHTRPQKAGQKGEIIKKPMPFPVSRAMLVCPRCGKPSRMGTRTKEGKKYRVCKKCHADI